MTTTDRLMNKILKVGSTDGSSMTIPGDQYEWAVQDTYLMVSTRDGEKNWIYPMCNLRCLFETNKPEEAECDSQSNLPPE